ncbi:hypothetical protein N0V93_002364 [Gnomoniopsis smithogilvyi]|uniref:Helix-turn-helix domain-containing protein n=1 Tax=Gnomoniopsis smithogilvyi TaxID=1191159 RepID=A0A9W8YYH7_9PEZI|nr:hypothetical protein N0V93_002364 [Gnomoniopsis smithogilvyi]
MGSGPSKSAAQSTIRKFPNRAPGSAVPPPVSSPPSNAAARAASERAAAQRAAAERANEKRGQRGHRESAAASLFKDEAIREDGYDPHMSSPDNMIQPDLAKRLREIGVVQPNPTFSNSSTATTTSSQPHSQLEQTENSGPIFPAASQNAVLSALEARRRVQREAEVEFENLGLSSSEGRNFLHAGMIRDILVMRERGANEAAIENRFNLKRGVVKRLGPPHLYKPAVGGEPLPV